MLRAVVVLVALLAVQGAQWEVLHDGFTTILIGLECADNSTCYMSGAVNGGPHGGPQVWRTDDFGRSFNIVPHVDGASMFLDVAAPAKTSAVVCGMGMLGLFPSTHYTFDGKVLNGSKTVEMMAATQSIERIVGTRGGFATTGEFIDVDSNKEINGVGISMDGGVNFKHLDVPVNTSARYGAFPSPNVWYITAGFWPSYRKSPGSRQLTSRISVDYDEFAAVEGAPASVKHRLDLSAGAPASPGWKGAVATTKDGGRTWKQVFWTDEYYLNAISCPTENKCWAVGESDTGARIIHTSDGGQTWQVQLHTPTSTHSLIAMYMVDEREGWAGGGNMAQDFYTLIYHTVDGGKTWTQETPINGYYINYFGMGPKAPSGAYRGLATAFNRNGDSSVFAYN